jgi:hypothetical protein
VRKAYKILLFVGFASFIFLSCSEEKKTIEKPKHRIFQGYHEMLDEIIRSKDHVFRGLDLNARSEDIRKTEAGEPLESTEGHLYYEYRTDSATHYSIDYALHNDSLEEINVQINSNDLELMSYLFCDLKDYYANKLPNPTEDKGYVIYNCFEGQRKPFVVSLSDNSSPALGIINMLIYKDK